MKINRQSQLHYRIQHIIFVFLLLACIGFAGWLSNEYNMRSDWTEGNRHSLSKGTLKLLEQLPFEITLRSYQADNPALTKAITEILNRYKTKKNNFTFKLINPDIFVDQAKADNIKRYGQTIIEYNGQREHIEKISEEAITNALIRLQRGDKPKLFFLSQHGERSLHDASPHGYSLLVKQLTDKGFEASEINLITDTLTTHNSVLIISSITQSLLQTEQQKILQFIENGGTLLWLQDPSPDASQLSIAKKLNLHFIDGIVIDNNQEVNAMLKLSHPAIIPILEYHRHPITNTMQYFTLFTTATAISANNNSTDSNWISTDLLITSSSSWSETNSLQKTVEYNEVQDLIGPLSIGIAQQRQIEIATKTEKQKASQRIVVIGDSDFISNQNLGQGANLSFILNTFNWLTTNNRLITIAAKNAPDTQLNLSSPTAAIIGLVFLFFIPLAFFISGVAIWFKRHKK